MDDRQQNEMAALRAELEEYRKEKEQIRRVIGAIGGAELSRKDKLFNLIIFCVLAAILVLDILRHFFHINVIISSMFSLEIGVFLISLKIILMIHKQAKVEHFQFWILNSIEFRINALAKQLRTIDKKLDKLQNDKS